MAISDNNSKVLWGRAAGICTNPGCREDLTVLIEGYRSFNVGEMAHVIAKSPEGPRGESGGGSDEYDNLVLLCPTCHRKVDKAPEGMYPPESLHRWKIDHERTIRASGSNQVFSSVKELKTFVVRALAENSALWSSIGPKSETATTNPGSNLHEAWTLRKLDTIVPNNTKIVNAVEANINLLSEDEMLAFFEFKSHATAWERHQYQRLDAYPQFPTQFAELMRQ
jgi:hypothetical protein